MTKTALEACCSSGLLIYRKFLKTANVEVGLQTIYSISRNKRVGPAVRALDTGWVGLFFT